MLIHASNMMDNQITFEETNQLDSLPDLYIPKHLLDARVTIASKEFNHLESMHFTSQSQHFHTEEVYYRDINYFVLYSYMQRNNVLETTDEGVV